jgi:D-threo-aldose 1-dehydrogenase
MGNALFESLSLPKVIFGTSGLGNLYQAVPFEEKKEIVRQCILHSPGRPVFDSAGKYGAGLALEVLGACLADLNVNPADIIISNKLGWLRTPLTGPEPSFEKGVWVDIRHDAVQKISYDGILECFNQGNVLLGNYSAQMVSVHDPDEYLATARSVAHEKELYQDILDAYRALAELKQKGEVSVIGVGSKDWKVIRRIAADVKLDWVMIANSLTVISHPRELLDFISLLAAKNIKVINSAVFNGGFLTGSDYFNYQQVDRNADEGRFLYTWRERFFGLCEQFNIQPAEACFQFGFSVPGVESVAMNTTRPEKVKANIGMANQKLPEIFWRAMRDEGLINTYKINEDTDL